MVSQCSHRSVLVAGNFLSSSGRNRQFVEELADRLERRDWVVLRTSRVASPPLRLADMAVTIWRRRAEFAVGHIAVFSGRAFIWAEVAALMMRIARRPYLLSLHGGNLPLFARRWPGRVRRLLQGAAAVVAPSRYLCEELRSYRADVGLFPNPLDLCRYRFRPRDRPHPNLIWLRAFHEIYNPSLAPRVVALLSRDLAGVELIMVGPDKDDGSLERTRRAAVALGVADQIALPGGVRKTEVPAWLDKADIFLNTANVDNAPVSLLEAMACGSCIVSTRVGGIPYIVEDGRDALLVPPDDPDAMAAAVRRILDEPGLSEKLSRSARAKAAGLDWSLILPQWEALYVSVAAGQGP